ncbi:hypothetical protein [Sporosarcina sp. ITBMC105]
MNINLEKLIYVLSRRFNKTIISTDFQTIPLQGVTVGDVCLLTGIAETVDGERLPYRNVRKIQKKWDRYGDPGSWRREFDLYTSILGETFSKAFRWPICYHAEFNTEVTEYHLWLEYIDCVTGLALTGDMYEKGCARVRALSR